MEQLIFFAIIIVFSIIDSIARSKKKRQQQTGGSGQDTSSVPDERDWKDELPTYDEEPSYDDTYEVETTQQKRETLPPYTGPYGSRETAKKESPGSSEGMVPADIWEEIAGLARGRTPARRSAPKPPEPIETTPAEAEPIPVRATRVGWRPEHRAHRSHRDFGTDPSTRRRSEQDNLDPMKVGLSRDVRSVRRQLKTHTRSALRRAVILQEVLGPPAAAAPERFPESA
ncbi:MAG: hypothetical protein PVJ80_07680 [Gemmatimonadota bacterium]|jgi:hypothetical protein